jgi:hypothetical protein
MNLKIAQIGTVLFFLAILHIFITPLLSEWFSKGTHSEKKSSKKMQNFLDVFLHLLTEVEFVLGFWGLIFVLVFAVYESSENFMSYQDSLDFTEPLFVFVIMVVSASRPILWLSEKLIEAVSSILARPFKKQQIPVEFFVILTLGPLAGSFITEPAAMTVSALLLLKVLGKCPQKILYAAIGVLFVNVSIGGALTSYAAPPILMVAKQWNWDTAFVFSNLGYKALIAVLLNALIFTLFFAKQLNHYAVDLKTDNKSPKTLSMRAYVVVLNLALLILVVLTSHYPKLFTLIFLVFMGLTGVTGSFHDRLRIKESFLVAFFLSGVIIFGPAQKWWVEPLILSLSDHFLFIGATLLTAVTDNAALTYLGTQVPHLTDSSKLFLVAGALTGGGLTVMANAPNPAGYSILRTKFVSGIKSSGLFLGALVPTIIAGLCFYFL